VRWKTLGQQGMCELTYDVATGTYSEEAVPEVWDDWTATA